MTFFLDMIALAGGLVIGGICGYAIGAHWRLERRTLWTIGIAAFAAATMLNFVGRYAGLEWLSIGSIGLMAGVTSGVKYGGFPDVRIWETQPPRAEAEPSEDAQEDPPLDVAGE